jgi:anthraniloyl-CoA monooxygenase
VKVATIGGGPGGLYASILLARLGHDVKVWERNAPDDTFGFGVVFSDETLAAFEAADPKSYKTIADSFARWADIDIYYRGTIERSGGHGFSALGRMRLLNILQERAEEVGVEIEYRTDAPPHEGLMADYDLVIAADGINSPVREAHREVFGATIDRRPSKFMWLGTDLVYEAFTFQIVETEWGVFQIHAYPYDETRSTFLVETDEATWRRAGFDATEDRVFAPGENDEEAIERFRTMFAAELRGHQLFANNSQWINFRTIRTPNWRHENLVLLGDAAHTAHFSIGSGTKLAMEDATALAWSLMDADDDIAAALQAYEVDRRAVTDSTQRAAQASLEWFEGISRYVGQSPPQFAFNLLTRSRRITYDNLKMRDPEFMRRVDEDFHSRLDEPQLVPPNDNLAGPAPASSNGTAPELKPPMFTSLRLRDLELANRVVVSPMDMYSAVDGAVGDFHLVHLGIRGIGGAGLVMTEMVCVAAEGRITPGCGGLYRDDQVAGWGRIVDFVHGHGGAKIGCQIGHSGRKGSTRLMWDGVDQPLEEGNWEILAPSPVPYFEHSQVPKEMTHEQMKKVREQFVESAHRAEEAGFDLLEIHLAHGYLLSSFLSPLTNRRTDEYGGDLAGRSKYPLEVVAACRAVWPQEKPMSVRISATDWADGGFTGDEAVALAEKLKGMGIDIIDVSTGQVWAEEKPAYGRSYQTPYADRIRNEVDVPTIAVGAISSYDDVNTTILAGRSDLCAIGRSHLYDPFWTLHAAADQEVGRRQDWIVQYQGGSRRPMDGKIDVKRQPLRSFDPPEPEPDFSRWRPAERVGK